MKHLIDEILRLIFIKLYFKSLKLKLELVRDTIFYHKIINQKTRGRT